jgi:aminopeptidase N
MKLTHADAKLRSESVLSGINYTFYMNLKKGPEYHGNVNINFSLKKVENVFLDFRGKKIVNFRVNDGSLISEENEIQELWQKPKLNLKAEWLLEGSNSIEIQFDNDYDTDGNGLHTFTDLDGKQYIYTQSEPYYFSKVLPSFDQPDLKGYAKFYIMHSQDWKVISNTQCQVHFSDLSSNFLEGDCFMKKIKQSRSDDFKGDSKFLSIFKRTKRLSSYLYSVVAGPYERIDLPESERFKNIPMSIYYRKSLEEYAVSLGQKVFEVSKLGIEFYEKFFGHDYPFSKWDTAFCPEFTVGAMEYPGVVTYNDKYIFKEKNPSQSRLSYLSTVILHEMAHMWYGNYVTMKWWDDLWLNESFAEFMNYKSFSEIQGKLSFPTDNAWSMMNEGKNWGYSEDANNNTHPIACDVMDTLKADSIFDGITYSKGAAVIQQLYYLIGDELFRKNIKSYFEEFKWKNTELKDLLRHLEQGNDAVDLKSWNQQWIKSAGTNTIRVEWDSTKQGTQTIKLHQGARLSQHTTMREHKLDLAFYNEKGELALTKTVSILPNEITEMELDNKGYKAVLPNANDWTFIVIELDQVSREFFIQNMAKLDELSMLLIVRSLYADVKQAKIKADVFIDVVLPNLKENLENPTLVKEFGSFVQSAIGFIPHELRTKPENHLFELVWELSHETKTSTILSELKRILMGSAINAKSITRLYKATLKENEVGQNMSFTDRDRATINYLMVLIPEVDSELKKKAQETIETESKSKEEFKNRKLSVDSFLMTKEEKLELWKNEVINPKRTRSYVELTYTLLGLRSRYNSESDRQMLFDEYFLRMPTLTKNEEKQIVETILNYGMGHSTDTKLILQKYEEMVKEVSSEFARNEILKEIDDLKILLKAFELYK